MKKVLALVLAALLVLSVFGCKKPEPQPEPAPEPEPQPEPEPEAESEPQPEEAPEEEEDEEQKYWKFVSTQLKNARHAVSAGSYIRANEILNVLRKMLIELICVNNGVEEDFENSIDFIECEEKDMLIKTFPRAMNAGGLAAALGAVSELFDRLS